MPASHPQWFCALVVVWSGYQARAGFNYGLFVNETLKEPRKDWRRLGVYGAHHAVLCFACSVAGFAAWAVAFAAKVESWPTISVGTGTVLVALGACAILGVSGALSRLLYLRQRVW